MPPVWCACLKFKPQGLCLAPRTVEAALAVALFTGILPGIDVRLVSLGRASADTALLRSRRGADHYATGQWTGALQIGPYRCMLRDVSLGVGCGSGLAKGEHPKSRRISIQKKGGGIPTCMFDRGRISGEQLRADCFCVAGPGLRSLAVC